MMSEAFINKTYLLDVVTVAQRYGFGNATFWVQLRRDFTTGAVGMKNYFAYGTGCGNLLSYGDFDTDGAAIQSETPLKEGPCTFRNSNSWIRHYWYRGVYRL